MPQLAFAVALVTCTDADAPEPKSPKLQFRVWLGAEPAIEHEALAGLIDQLTPVPLGNGSVSVTPAAVPGPLFDTPIVKPIASPALTCRRVCHLRDVEAGHCTVMLAEAVTAAWFVAWALAVLL